MKLPREYRKFIGNYDACKSAYGKKMLRKFGFGPETAEVVERSCRRGQACEGKETYKDKEEDY